MDIINYSKIKKVEADLASHKDVIYEDVDMLKGLRIHKGIVEPTDTPFWYDTSDTTEIVRRDTNGQT